MTGIRTLPAGSAVRLDRLFFAAAAGLLPWVALLAVALPATTQVRHWSVAWVGLDALQAAGLIATGVLLVRRHPAVSLVAGVTAGLLLVDGWFDVVTAQGGRDYLAAILMAMLVELPLGGLCLLAGYRAVSGRRPAAASPPVWPRGGDVRRRS